IRSVAVETEGVGRWSSETARLSVFGPAELQSDQVDGIPGFAKALAGDQLNPRTSPGSGSDAAADTPIELPTEACAGAATAQEMVGQLSAGVKLVAMTTSPFAWSLSPHERSRLAAASRKPEVQTRGIRFDVRRRKERATHPTRIRRGDRRRN